MAKKRKTQKQKVNTFRNPSVSITIRHPSVKEKRRSFALSLVVVDDKGKRSQQGLKSDSLTTVNRLLRAKEITHNQALEMVENLKERELKKHRKILGFATSEGAVNRTNKRISEKYLDRALKKPRISKQTKNNIKYEIQRVLGILGELSLVNSTKEDIDEAYWSPKNYDYSCETLKRTLSKLNNLLEEAGRDFKISVPPNLPKHLVKYIDESELKLLLTELNRPIDKLAVKIMFYTGLRTGELFALPDNLINYKKQIIEVNNQRLRDWELKAPKMNKIRKVVFPSYLKSDIESFLDFSDEYLQQQRLGLTNRVLAASRRCWGKNKHKHISNHRLRNSHAIWMIEEHGIDLTQLSYQLGDTIEVIQLYYSGFVMTKGIAEQFAKKLG